MAHCMIHGAPEKISVVFLNDLFWPRGEMADFAKTSPWSSRLGGRLCVSQKGWKVVFSKQSGPR